MQFKGQINSYLVTICAVHYQSVPGLVEEERGIDVGREGLNFCILFFLQSSKLK
jgi:hypothetical protein